MQKKRGRGRGTGRRELAALGPLSLRSTHNQPPIFVARSFSMRVPHTQAHGAGAQTPPCINRRIALAGAAAAVASTPRPSLAAPAPFCGVLGDVLPPWTFSSPWREEVITNDTYPLWTRVVGKPPAEPLLARFRSAANKPPPPPPYPVLVIPGEPGLPCTYLESLELLAANRCAAFFDPPSVGRSRGASGSSTDATPAGQVAAIHAVAAALWPPLQRYHIVAHGLGGLFALDGVSDDRVASITLLATPPSPAAGVAGRLDRATALLGRDAAATLAAGPSSPGYADAVAAFTSAAVVKRPAGCVVDARDRAAADITLTLAGANPLFSLGGALAQWTPPQVGRPLPPILIINGGDGSIRSADAAALAAATGADNILTVPAAGDYVHVDTAAEVVDAVEAFVSGVETGGRSGPASAR